MSLSWITDSVVGRAPAVAPERAAVGCGAEQPLSWSELRAAELRVAAALQRAGVGRGDRVAMLMRNSVDYIVIYLAIARVGAISTRLNFRLTGPEAQFILADSGSRLLILDADFADRVVDIRDQVSVESYVVRGDAAAAEWAIPYETFLAAGGECRSEAMDLDDPATLLYTSGTTGTPKGAIWSHGNSLWFGSIQAMKWKFDAETVAMTPGPLFHAGGLEALLLAALTSHGTAITFPSGAFGIETLLAAARAQEAKILLLYSFMSYELLRLPEVEKLVPPSLKQIACGGDIVMPWVYDELEKQLPGIEMFQLYGLTEGGAVSTTLDHADARAHPDSVGRPMPMTEVKVVAEDGGEAAVDEVGEVHVRSPAVSVGFWQRPEADAEVFYEGWCRTGDLGRIDAEGFLTLAGRSKDMIRSGAENVYPAEIEGVLTAARGVADAAVIGVPDAKYVEVGCAVLVPIEGERIDLEELRGHCAERLAKFKIPKHFVVVPELPRTPSGKVKKFELRERYGSLGDTEP